MENRSEFDLRNLKSQLLYWRDYKRLSNSNLYLDMCMCEGKNHLVHSAIYALQSIRKNRFNISLSDVYQLDVYVNVDST